MIFTNYFLFYKYWICYNTRNLTNSNFNNIDIKQDFETFLFYKKKQCLLKCFL